MDVSSLISFLLAAMALTIMPGPDNIFVLTESITKGKRNGIAVSAGLASGVIVHTFIVASGLALFVQTSPTIFNFIKYFGAAYLFYLVYSTLKEKSGNPTKDISETETSVQKERFSKLVKQGFLMNVLNPKVTLFFIAFLPQFVSKTGYPFEIQTGVLGLIFMLQAFIVFSSIAVVSTILIAYVKSDFFWQKVKWIKVSVLSVLAVLLIFK